MSNALRMGGGQPPSLRLLQAIWRIVGVYLGSFWLLAVPASDVGARDVGASDAHQTSRRILTLDQDDSGRPVALAGYAKLRQVLLDELQGRVVISSEALDMARFNRAGYLNDLRGWIKTKYEHFKPEVIVALGEVCLDFAVSLRAELWPDVEIIFGAIPDSVLRRRTIPPHCTGVVHYDFRMAETIHITQQLFPNTKRLAFIAGNVEREPFNQAVYEEFQQLSDRFETIDLTNLSMDELTARVSSLPEDTVIFYSAIFIDGSGTIWGGPQALRQFAPFANCPIVANSESYIGLGVVGGQVLRIELLAEDLAHQTLRVLGGEAAEEIPVARRNFTSPLFDHRQLRRWHVPAERLPTNSILQFQQFSLWELHRGKIISIATLLTLQSSLLIGFFVQRWRRRRAERSLRETQSFLMLAGESAELGIWIWDLPSDQMSFNLKGAELLRLGSVRELSKSAFEALLHPEDRPFRELVIRGALQRHEEYEVEYRVLGADGVVRWFTSRGFPQGDAEGRVRRVLGVIQDVTRRKQVEHELTIRREEAAHLTRIATMGELAASIAHELGQPLEAMVNYTGAAHVVLNSPQPDLNQIRGIVADAERAGLRACDVVTKIRRLYQKRPFQFAALDVIKLLSDTLQLVEQSSASRPMRIQVECGESLPPVRGDFVYLQQVLINLLQNAFEASCHLPLEQRECQVTARRAGVDRIVFSVRDRGTGIDNTMIGNLFDPFQSGKPAGTGLGLALVRTIIEGHGGRCWAENNPDFGATLSFEIPTIGKDS